MDNLRSIDEIPPPYRNIFTEYPCFNAVQSQVLNDVLYTDKSVVVSAPTGSGKTAIFEMALTKLLIQYENLNVPQMFKVVYISPIKALCHERLTDWHNKFSPFGINCIAATGDSDHMDIQQLTHHNLIISTPEKWDSLTRRWRDYEKVVKVIKLFMIDEVHLLNEENRGSTLEVIVSRMKTVENSITHTEDEHDIFNQKVRFIAVSATVPNVEDIAEWIGKPPNTKYFRISEEMRPVKLKKIVYGYSYNPKATSPFKFDISLNYKLSCLMMQYSEGKPTLIFCSTRKSVEMTANHIVHSLKITLNEDQKQKLLDVANMIADVKAKVTIKHGIGYHHAGLIPETRRAIENLFRNGDLPVLVTTSTLAMGVNLPAHLVIIKSTKCYDNGGFRDYTETAIHQMIGRAGRPQFDTSATALILTTSEDKPKFERMMGSGLPIESNLHRHLTEHLNAEIVLRTITDLDVALQWLSSTFLYVRARKNPRHYGINVGFTQEQIDRKLLEICQIDLNKLVKTGMITMDENIIITPNAIGKIMAKYYVAFETMKLFTQISGTEILIQILALISKCQEFESLRLRVNDKKTLNLLNKNSKKDTIRFPLNGKIKTWDMKVNCIIQAVLGNLDILDHSILSDSLSIMRNGERLAKCLIAYLQTRGSNCYNALLNSITLAKCFHAKLWENSEYVSKQLTGIGSAMSNQLKIAGKTTFKKILESNPRDIEVIIKRKPPMGDALIKEVEQIPRYTMTLEKVGGGKQLYLCILLENADDLTKKPTVNLHSSMTLLVGTNLNEILVYEKYEHAYMIENPILNKHVGVDKDMEEVSAHFISEDWVGIDCNCCVQLQTAECKKYTKKAEDAKSPDKEGPTYIQTFLDMYMKTKKKATEAPPKKKIATKRDTAAKSLNSFNSGTQNTEVQKQSSVIEVENERCTKEGEKCEANVKSNLSKSDFKKEKENAANFKFTQEDEQALEEIFNMSDMSMEILEDKSVQDSENATTDTAAKTYSKEGHIETVVEDIDKGKIAKTEDIPIPGKDCEKVEKIEDSKPSSFEERLIKAPFLFRLSQKYGQEIPKSCTPLQKDSTCKRKKKVEDIERAMEFENSLYKDDVQKRQKLQEFKFPTKKKFNFESTKQTLPDSTVDKKYYIKEILEPGSKHKNIFDLNASQYETVDLSEDRNKENAQKCITWSSPLVVSPAVKFSPKINYQNISYRSDGDTDPQSETNNDTFETTTSSRTNLTVNIQKTPNQSQSSRYSTRDKERATQFLLRDKDYRVIKNDEGNDTLDICSNSFMDKLGFTNNQFKRTPKKNRTEVSPTLLNYYQKFVNTPIKSKKQKSQCTTDGNTEVDNTEDKENYRGSPCINNSPEKNCMQQPKTDPNQSNQESFTQMRHCSQQPLPKRESQLQEYTNSCRENPYELNAAQNRTISYSNNPYVSQNDLNGSYVSHNFHLPANNTHYYTDNHLIPYTPRNYNNMHNPNYHPQDPQRYSSYTQNPTSMNQICIRSNNCMRPYNNESTPYNYHPRRSQFVTATCGGMCQNVEPHPDLNFGRHLECVRLNRSQLVDDAPDFQGYHQPREHSQYFQEYPPRMENVYRPIAAEGAEVVPQRIFSNSQIEDVPQSRSQQYPEMMSLQELSQPVSMPCGKPNKIICSQNRSLVQQKSFEEKMNEENTLRNMETSFFGPISKRDAFEASTSRNDRCFLHSPINFTNRQGCYPRQHSGESETPQRHFDRAVNEGFYSRQHSGESEIPQRHYDRVVNEGFYPRQRLGEPEIPQRHFDTGGNEDLKFFNKSLSYEEKPDRIKVPQQTQLSGHMSRLQRDDLNPSFRRREQYWNAQEENYGRAPSLNRNFVTAVRPHSQEQNFCFQSNNEEMETFPPTPEKKYVMNKFLYSLNQQ